MRSRSGALRHGTRALMEAATPSDQIGNAMSRGWSLAGSTASTHSCLCASAQVLRGDLDWLSAPLSFYLIGPYALRARGAYFGLAAALVALGVGFYRALSPRGAQRRSLLLFVCGGIALVVTALAETSTHLSPPTLEGFIHASRRGRRFCARPRRCCCNPGGCVKTRCGGPASPPPLLWPLSASLRCGCRRCGETNRAA